MTGTTHFQHRCEQLYRKETKDNVFTVKGNKVQHVHLT